MTRATVGQVHGGLLGGASAETISVRAPWEGVWPAKLANDMLPPFIVLLRLTMGWIFVWAGFDKLIRGFSASGFLIHGTQGPLTGWFQGLGENTTAVSVIDPLVVWSQILIGIALIFGIGFRWAALWGAVQMFFFYIAAFPPAHNPFMDEHLVYIIVLGALGALGAGRILGLDAVIERLPWVRRIPGATFLLG